MSATELDEVLALMNRVLPDPTGFAERLVQQAVVWWAGSRPDTNPPDVRDDERTIDVTPDEVRREAPVSHAMLAAALGACECWGVDDACRRCAGTGSSGWNEPDVDLFHLFVGPAAERLTHTFDQDTTHAPGRREGRPQTTGDTT